MSPKVLCPECGEKIKLKATLKHDGDDNLSFFVDVDVQPVWDHAAKHVWEAGGDS